MLATRLKEPSVDFYMYPPVGGDDWRYVRQTALVRVYEMQMLTRAALHDMANAASFEAAAGLLSATEYALPQAGRSFTELEDVLRARRTAVRQLFSDLMLDEPIVELFRSRDDFANLRLALRRTLTEKPVGNGYSEDGNFPPDEFAEVFEQDNYGLLPDFMQKAAEQAVLAYYQSRDPALREQKDIRQIDYAIDAAQAEYNLRKAHEVESVFLLGLFRIQVDLTNIRTILRLKFTESELTNVFLRGGYLELERLRRGLELGYESLGPLFFVTPYHRVVESGANYVASNKSFLGVEQQCDAHLIGFLRTTIQITAGPQPIIAYLLMKEHEIRTIRLILTAKKNHLDTKLILDRIG
jgi:V/A-type H+-transporting ATPase subunit C